VYKKSLTLLEQIDLFMQINRFIEKRIPQLIKYKLSLLANQIKPRIDLYDELKKKLVKQYGDNDQLKNIVDGQVNPKYLSYLKEMRPVEEAKDEINFNQYALSMVLRKNDDEDEGGYPRVYELFYLDSLAERLFEKWMSEKHSDLEAELTKVEEKVTE